MATTLSIIPNPREKAALTIQKAFRGYRNRFTLAQTLNESVFQAVYPLLCDVRELRKQPRAEAGKTTVYLPKACPVVVKESGVKNAQDRLERMKEARKVLWRHGLDRLTIPSARVDGPFILEQLLPISPANLQVSIGIYLGYPEEFDLPVQQLATFLCLSDPQSDLTGNTSSPYATFSETLMPRYDNVAPYRDPKSGAIKLALVDLEGYKVSRFTSERQYDEIAEIIKQVLRFFPHHLKIILEAAGKFNSKINNHTALFLREQDEALGFLNRAYVHPLNFLNQHGITAANPAQLPEITAELQTALQEFAVNQLKAYDKKSPYKGFLGTDPEGKIEDFKKTFPLFLKNLRALIQERLLYNLEKHKISKDSPIGAILACRTIILDENPGVGCYGRYIEEALTILPPFDLKNSDELRFLSSDLSQGLLKEMAKNNLFSYYNPSWGSYGNTVQGVFC